VVYHTTRQKISKNLASVTGYFALDIEIICSPEAKRL